MERSSSGWITKNKEMIAIKHIPNIITSLRLVFSIILLFIKPFSILFFLFYILCGISDVLDGYIARKINCNSPCGATFDSIADLLFITILLIIFIPIIPWSKWMLFGLFAIVGLRFFSLVIGFIKYHTLTFLHTYANKAAGLTLFCFPILYYLFGLPTTTALVFFIAGVSAMEELIIMITSKELHRDIKSFLNI